MAPLRTRASIIIVLVLAAVGFVWSGAVGAHAEIRETSPAPRSEVDSIGPVDMVFWSEVQSGSLTVSDLDGGIRTAVGQADGDFVLRFEVDPVVEPGTYRIDVAYVSTDGDQNARAWTVTVVDGGPTPARLTAPEIMPIEEAGSATVTIVAGVVLFACTALLVALVLRRARNRLDDLQPEPEPEPTT